jgi:chromosome segregation ATPase
MWSPWRDNARTIEEQLAALRAQIEAAEAELVDREAELAELRVEMHAFQLKYELTVGRKMEALQQLDAAIARCKKQISDYRQWGGQGRPRTADGQPFVSVEEQYRRTWQDPPPPEPWFPPPPMPPAQSRDLKTLYRQLCRRFHPDLTQDAEERAWRTEMMAAVNAAYDAQSLTELQALAARPARPLGRDAGGGSDRQRIEALQAKLRHIRGRIRAIEHEIYDLTHDSLVEMSLQVKLASSEGQDLLAEMAAEVEKNLERKQAELDFLQAQLRQFGIDCD